MKRRDEMILLGVLLVVLAGVLAYLRFYSSSTTASAPPTPVDAKFTPLNVDNPALRLDILQRFLALQYKGVHRSIFSATLPPPPKPVAPVQQAVIVPPGPPPGPPPLTVDAKYFGFVSDFGGSHRRAFFSTANNDDVIIAGEGDTLMGRFRVIRITATTADVEEISSSRRATLTLEEPGPTG